MVGIKGVSGMPEPAPERPASVRGKKAEGSIESGKAKDDVLISNEAQAAATIARLVQVAGAEPDVRVERVTAAKERIEKGDYKRPEVVAQVAKRISKYLP